MIGHWARWSDVTGRRWCCRDGKLLPVPFFRPGGAGKGPQGGEELRRALVRHWLDCEEGLGGTLVARYHEEGEERAVVSEVMGQFMSSVLETEAVHAVYGTEGGAKDTQTAARAGGTLAPPLSSSSSSRRGRESRAIQEDADLALALSLAEQEQQDAEAAAAYRNTVPESWWTRQRQQQAGSGGSRRRGHWWTPF